MTNTEIVSPQIPANITDDFNAILREYRTNIRIVSNKLGRDVFTLMPYDDSRHNFNPIEVEMAVECHLYYLHFLKQFQELTGLSAQEFNENIFIERSWWKTLEDIAKFFNLSVEQIRNVLFTIKTDTKVF